VDHVRWVFDEPVKIETPGINSRLREVRQYRDRIEFSIGIWASVTIRFVGKATENGKTARVWVR